LKNSNAKRMKSSRIRPRNSDRLFLTMKGNHNPRSRSILMGKLTLGFSVAKTFVISRCRCDFSRVPEDIGSRWQLDHCLSSMLVYVTNVSMITFLLNITLKIK
jgi:hypothetical protein